MGPGPGDGITRSKPAANVSVLFDADQIAARVAALAKEIAGGVGGDFLVISILKGSFVFSADLIRAMHGEGMHPQIDFITLSSYGEATESSGHVEITRDVTDRIRGRTIMLVDDILESGRTLSFAKTMLLDRAAGDVKVCVFLDKANKRKVPIEADFVGFACPDEFVVGYGLDYAHYYRELPYVGILESG